MSNTTEKEPGERIAQEAATGKGPCAHLTTALLFCGLGIGSPVATAQEEDAPAEAYIEEIIVTAEKREESVLQVPLTLTAFSEQMIEELGMTNALDLEQMVPGLQFGSAPLQQRSDGQGITIRGIGTQSARELHSDLAVAIYVDGVYTVDTFGLAPNLFDVERVEVARGPQGTLNGRNSIAGAIHFHSKRPDFDWDADVLAELTDQTSQRLNVAFGGPMNEHVAFRINAGMHTGAGTQENVGPGDDLGAPDLRTLSPQIRFRNDVLDMTLKRLNVQDKGSEEQLVYFGERDRNNPDLAGQWYLYDREIPSIANCSNPIRIVGFRPQPIDGTFHCDDLRNAIDTNSGARQTSDTDRNSFNADWKLSGGLTLRYTYGQSETRTAAAQDGDGTSRVGSDADPAIPADLSGDDIDRWRASGAAFGDQRTDHIFTNDESSHELQLISDLEGPLNFVAGIYTYENETYFEQGTLDFASPIRFVSADDAAVAASPIFGVYEVTSCASYLDDFFLPTFGDPASRTAFGLGVECPVGNDHTKQAAFFSATTSETTAYFANAEYRINDQWSVAGGLRNTEDEKTRINLVPPDLEAQSGNVPAGNVAGGLFVGDFFGTGVPVAFTLLNGTFQPVSWDATIGHVSVEYTPMENRMYYGRISTGYRAGGFNFAGSAIRESFDEETLVNYEVGMKGLFMDNRLQITSGAFWQVFENYQLTANQPIPSQLLEPTRSSPLAEQTINVEDDTSIRGIEVEWVYQVNESWRLSGYYNWLTSELGDHSTVVRADPDQQTEVYQYTNPRSPGPDGEFGTADDFIAFNEIPIPRNHGGEELPQMPNHKLAATLSYSAPTETLGGSLQLLSTVSYTGERWPQRSGNIERARVPAYTRWDARAIWESSDRQWTAALYVQNILDKIGIAESIAIDLIGALTEPRQVGLLLRWRPQF